MHIGTSSFCLLYGVVLVHCEYFEYHYINLPKSWSDARQYCRDHYTDLATIENVQDVYRITVSMNQVWIGLSDDPASWRGTMTADSNSWKWSAKGTTSPGGYQNWKHGEPNNSGLSRWCVAVNSAGWWDVGCTASLKFLCYTVQSSGKEYVLIHTLMTWDNAQTYCKQNYQDLAMIETASENQAVKDIVTASSISAWIGLSRQAFGWSDGNPCSYRHWAPSEPYGDGQCATQMSDNYWNDAPCGNAYHFICHKALNKTARLHTKLTLKSTMNLADPAITDMVLKLLGKYIGDSDVGFNLTHVIQLKNVEEIKDTPACIPEN